MRNIEKSLTSYLKGNGQKISNDTILAYASRDANEMINILFDVINEELDSLSGNIDLTKIRQLFEIIPIIIGTSEGVNRKIVSRRLQRLNEKIDRIQIEKRRRFTNRRKANEELEKVRKLVENASVETEEVETKQYDFISYLTDSIRNISYLEYTFKKLPKLVNAKDKNNKSLFQNTVHHYLESIEDENVEDSLYYSTVLSLIMAQDAFSINEQDRKKVLDELYVTIEHLSVHKSMMKKNKERIREIEELIDIIKEQKEKGTRLNQLSKKYNISISFSREFLEEVKELKIPNTDRYKVDDYTITIDKEGSIEIDDALSCRRLPNGNYLLGVHIASALGYFPYESPIIQEALSRNRSIYLPRKYQDKENDFNRVIPIFPYEFAAEKGSLLTGSPRLARSYYYEMAADGTIVNQKFLKTIVQSRDKMTYREVDQILNHGCKNKDAEDTTMNLQKVTELLEKHYHTSRLYEQIKESREDYSDLVVKRAGAEKIVYHTMLLTGNKVADFFAAPERDYPCLYRVHQVNDADSRKLQAMVDHLTQTYGGEQYKKLYQLIEGLYPKGWYGISGPHDGLGLDHYCHCTSTLRRAADIVVEHGLEVCYDKQPTDKELMKLEEEVKKRAAEINAKEDPIEWFIRDYKSSYQKRR